MNTIISLLRGINVGGSHLIRMETLREIYVEAGIAAPQTLLQSGNVVFTTRERNQLKLALRIEDAIEARMGFRPRVIHRTLEELRQTVAANPFTGRKDVVPGKLAVVFLERAPEPAMCRALEAMDIAPEELHVIGREMWIHFVNGQARPNLKWPLVERTLGMAMTARNWNTVEKLLEIGTRLSQTG